jgi:serine/threonine protein kinase/tetratricopeptide (TPR) repeat protein
MTPEQWKQINDLVEAALEIAPDQRAAFLSGACGGDSSLRDEVESLLSSCNKAEGFLDGLLDEAVTLIGGAEPPVAGLMIGSYRVIRELGRGGMGTVYLAGRADDTYKKRVAIKLIKRGMDTEDVVRRFRNERQILASLDHPNIARLLDGGTTSQGLPYFVMEYIDGQPIDRYCDEQRLTTVARLQLFRTVCAAVHYAHQNLVVHRDLKPSNILVTNDGVVKLLDFGIAKLLNTDLYAGTDIATAQWARPMTPQYASPEQARGQTLSTASDTYSLGVILYELLTGHRPYRIKGSTPQEIERIICEQEPEKPSTIVNRVETGQGQDGASEIVLSPEHVSRTREGQPEKLRRKLAGDIDNIVLMAMRKESHRRYASVEQFSDDIRLHLEGLPVRARKDTFGYRAEKFIRRHKAGVALTVLTALLIIGFSVISIVQSARVAAESERAKRERQRAEQVSTFLQDLFKVPDPSQSRGNTVTAREILDKGAEKVAQELKDQPETQATLMDTIGTVYFNIGLYDRAAPLLEEALKIRRQLFGNQHPDVARTMTNLVQVLGEMGDLETAEALTREALAIRRQHYGAEHPEIADSLNDLAYLSRAKGEVVTAEALYRESLAMRRKLLGNDDLYTASSLSNLAVLLAGKGDLEAAEALYHEALPALRKSYGDDHPDVALTLNNLGSLLREKGDYAAAERAHREALAIRIKLHGEEHVSISLSLHNLAAVLKEKGDVSEAEALWRRSLAMRRRLLPQGHRTMAIALTALGKLLLEKGEVSEAEPLLREALAIHRKSSPKNDWGIYDTAGALGACLTAIHRYEEAESLLSESYQELKTGRGADDKRTREALNRLITLYQGWGKAAKAGQYRALLANADEEVKR